MSLNAFSSLFVDVQVTYRGWGRIFLVREYHLQLHGSSIAAPGTTDYLILERR